MGQKEGRAAGAARLQGRQWGGWGWALVSLQPVAGKWRDLCFKMGMLWLQTGGNWGRGAGHLSQTSGGTAAQTGCQEAHKGSGTELDVNSMGEQCPGRVSGQTGDGFNHQAGHTGRNQV